MVGWSGGSLSWIHPLVSIIHDPKQLKTPESNPNDSQVIAEGTEPSQSSPILITPLGHVPIVPVHPEVSNQQLKVQSNAPPVNPKSAHLNPAKLSPSQFSPVLILPSPQKGSIVSIVQCDVLS